MNTVPFNREASGNMRDDSAYLTGISHALQAGLAVVDEDGCFTYVTPGMERLSGWTRDELTRRGLMKIIPAHLHRFMLEKWNDARRQGQTVCHDLQMLHKDGRTVPVMVTQQPLHMGEHAHVLLLFQDLVSTGTNAHELEQYRERLEQKVQERTAALVESNRRLSRSETALARAQASAHIGSWEWHENHKRPEWSRQMFLLHGLTPDRTPPTLDDIQHFIHPDDREQVRHAFEQALAQRRFSELEYRIIRADQAEIDVVARIQPAHHPLGQLRHISGTLQDITERKRLEREIVAASQHEQQRIGRDLHDTLGQELTGLSLLAKALEKQIAEVAPAQSAGATELSRIAAQAASHARDIAHGLSPVDLTEEGLSAELQRMRARVEKLYAIECQCISHADDHVHDNAVATHLYHIAQEAVTNAVKHATPNTVKIELWGGNPGKLVITNDRCAGAEVQAALADRAGRGSGLRIMRHRADIIKAKLSITHAPYGSRVSCTFPNRPPKGTTEPSHASSYGST